MIILLIFIQETIALEYDDFAQIEFLLVTIETKSSKR